MDLAAENSLEARLLEMKALSLDQPEVALLLRYIEP